MDREPDESAGAEAVYLSFVAPAFNEAESLPRLVEEVAAAGGAVGRPWEFVLADDCSEDDSRKVLAELARRFPQLRVVALEARSGQTAALEAGLAHARGAFIATLDADLQNDPAEVPRMLELIADGRADFVNGWRQKRQDNWLRLVSTRVANGVRNWLTRESIHDSACGLKVFRREVAESLKLFNGLHRFLPTLARMNGFAVVEIPVHHRPRTAGQAKYGVWNRVFKALRDCFAIRWMQSRNLRWRAEVWEDGDA
jgi:glycosyltransferase involved in cell wall biosynthesis